MFGPSEVAHLRGARAGRRRFAYRHVTRYTAHDGGVVGRRGSEATPFFIIRVTSKGPLHSTYRPHLPNGNTPFTCFHAISSASFTARDANDVRQWQEPKLKLKKKTTKTFS
ncbi:hypothetical protein AOLI_G00237540 [Acnodon oligacanthus]